METLCAFPQFPEYKLSTRTCQTPIMETLCAFPQFPEYKLSTRTCRSCRDSLTPPAIPAKGQHSTRRFGGYIHPVAVHAATVPIGIRLLGPCRFVEGVAISSDNFPSGRQ